MAHKKGEGKVKNGRDSHSKRLGVKIYGGQGAESGNIIIRQRGTSYHPGKGVMLGKDHTIFAVIDGVVKFTKGANDRRFVHVLPVEASVQA
jgi:large subunit ribosomal protein L27